MDKEIIKQIEVLRAKHKKRKESNKKTFSKYNEDVNIPKDKAVFRTTKGGKKYCFNPETGETSGLGKDIDSQTHRKTKSKTEESKSSSTDKKKKESSSESVPVTSSVPNGFVASGSMSSGGHRVINTYDAVNEKDENGNTFNNSLREHIDENGNLSEERQKVHDKILDESFTGKIPEEEGKRKMTMLGGGPASGKSSAEKAGLFTSGEKDKTVTINPDKMKEKLPGYSDMASKTDKAAGFYHEESSSLAKAQYSETLSGGYNALYDGTGDGSPNSVRKKIKEAEKYCSEEGKKMLRSLAGGRPPEKKKTDGRPAAKGKNTRKGGRKR